MDTTIRNKMGKSRRSTFISSSSENPPNCGGSFADVLSKQPLRLILDVVRWPELITNSGVHLLDCWILNGKIPQGVWAMDRGRTDILERVIRRYELLFSNAHVFLL